jgi:phenylpyruvate tautomerase PptA (4-oxalocrotonate tautomerase family)
MPFVTITIPTGRGEQHALAVSNAVNRTVIETMDFPDDDRYQVIHEVPDYALQLQKRSGDRVMMHLVMREGRSDRQKKAFYLAVTRALEADAGISPENVVITFTENRDIDWSFGEGVASFMPPHGPG